MKKTSYILLFVLAVFAVSCNRSREYDVQYLPFLEEEDGKYGLMSPDGKVLVSEEFKYIPTVATCGRFWAMNKDGYYELYKTGSEPERVGGEYRYVSPFYEGRAIVAERDKHISIVDKSGETVVPLEKIGKYRPDYITGMREGHAIFAVDTLQGVINYKGEMIVKPNYYAISPMYDGMVVAVDRNYAMCSDAGGKVSKFPKGYLTVINDHGEKVLKISSRKYAQCARRVYGDYLPVAEAKDTVLSWGVINMRGEVIVKPSRSNAGITDMQGENFVYMNEDGLYGVKNIRGEKIVEPKYEHLQFVGENLLVANMYIPEGEDVDMNSGLYFGDGKYISISGEKFPGKRFSVASVFIPTACKYALVADENDKWMVINNKGEKMEDAPRIKWASLNFGDQLIMSDYIDINLFLGNVGFSAGGVDSLTFNSGVKDVLNRQARHFSSVNTSKPADLLNTTQVSIFRTVDGQNVSETVYFPSALSRRTYKTETVYDYDYYYNSWGNYWDTYWYSYNRQVPAGFEFSNVTPSKFEMSFDNYGVLRGKLKQLYSKLSREFKQMGDVIDENNAAVLVRLANGSEAVVYLEGHNVVARWGTLSQSDKDIAVHAGAKETITLDK